MKWNKNRRRKQEKKKKNTENLRLGKTLVKETKIPEKERRVFVVVCVLMCFSLCMITFSCRSLGQQVLCTICKWKHSIWFWKSRNLDSVTKMQIWFPILQVFSLLFHSAGWIVSRPCCDSGSHQSSGLHWHGSEEARPVWPGDWDWCA